MTEAENKEEFDLENNEDVAELLESMTMGQRLKALGRAAETLREVIKTNDKLGDLGYFEVFDPKVIVELDAIEASVVLGSLLVMATIADNVELRTRVLDVDEQVSEALDKAWEPITEEQKAAQDKVYEQFVMDEQKEKTKAFLIKMGITGEAQERILQAADEEAARLAMMSEQEIGPAH